MINFHRSLASDVLFQAYLVDGLIRWNEDRGRAATSVTSDHPSYSGLLQHATNTLAVKVLKKKLVPSFTEPRKYTGKLLFISAANIFPNNSPQRTEATISRKANLQRCDYMTKMCLLCTLSGL
ncbi:hypothetical protein DPMN_041888 [Dreissena polymorpha]|uniref:Uncharacterized protein n=1 Tax=Dreissena polymorpha TaxID=45954 RepID=A0A9D4HWF9_DREPO|nr:hypothetical protein DPMN_041888 [Dreissena polymorpha]